MYGQREIKTKWYIIMHIGYKFSTIFVDRIDRYRNTELWRVEAFV